MPRIRSLKPEHKQHRKVGPLSHFEYRLWIGMVTEADDEGRLVADAAQLRALIFAFHPDVSTLDVDTGLLRLAETGLMRLYIVKKTRYAWLQSWHDHQKIDHPMPSKLPVPPGYCIPRTFAERSAKTRRSFVERSPSIRQGSDQGSDLIKDQGSDLIGSDRKGGEPEGREGAATPSTPGSPPALRSPDGLAPAARTPDTYETLARLTGRPADEIRREADDLRARQPR